MSTILDHRGLTMAEGTEEDGTIYAHRKPRALTDTKEIVHNTAPLDMFTPPEMKKIA